MEGRLELAHLDLFHFHVGTLGLLRCHDDFIAVVIVPFLFLLMFLFCVVVVMVVPVAMRMAGAQSHNGQEGHRENEIREYFLHARLLDNSANKSTNERSSPSRPYLSLQN